MFICLLFVHLNFQCVVVTFYFILFGIQILIFLTVLKRTNINIHDNFIFPVIALHVFLCHILKIFACMLSLILIGYIIVIISQP